MTLIRAKHAVDLLTKSMFFHRSPERRRHSFMYARSGRHPISGGFGIEVNYDHEMLLDVVLYLRRQAAPHLRSLSFDEIHSQTLNFVTENYWIISKELFGKSRLTSAISDLLSEAAKGELAEAMLQSDLFVEPNFLTLFPLDTVTVEQPISCQNFFLATPGTLFAHLPKTIRTNGMIADSFPPLKDWKGARHSPTSWLGITAPTKDAAKRTLAAILGAIALVPHHQERYQFSGRTVKGGRFSFHNGSVGIDHGVSHTPPLMVNVVITAADMPWLDKLAQKLLSKAKPDRRQLRALEYYYRAWAPSEVRRFPTLFAAIDAIFGDASAATQAVIDAVMPIMGPSYDYDRLRLILGLRASVVHGGAPNVYESDKYHLYYKKYREDPILDLQLIVARCLQTDIFEGSLVERPHTYAGEILEQTGRIV